MRARGAAFALGKAVRAGRDWLCMCPLHGGVSLSLCDGRNGALLAYCFAGCDGREVWQELRDRGLIGDDVERDQPTERRDEQQQREAAAEKAEQERMRRRIEQARALYRRGDARRTLVETYLRSRGITIPVPRVLRFVQHCPHRNGGYYPAMVAPVVNVAGEQIGVHKTFLKPGGSGKADLPKEAQRESCGILKGGAVRLADLDPGHRLDDRAPDHGLIVGEGIESTLSVMQLFGLPGWAALSANGIAVLELPDHVREVVIAADNDSNGVGFAAALAACEHWQGEGRHVEILMPPNAGDDFNDVLQGRL